MRKTKRSREQKNVPEKKEPTKQEEKEPDRREDGSTADLGEAGGRELRTGDLAVAVLVHLGEGGLGYQVLRLGLGVLGLDQAVHVLDQPGHLLLRDRAVAVDVEDTEDLVENLLGGALGHDVEDQHELDEVDVAVVVAVVDPEDVLFHLASILLGHGLRKI